MKELVSYADGVHAVDSGYGRPQLAAIHIVVHDGRAAIVDTGSNASVPQVLGALAALGIAPEAVDWVMLTHIHLDHAGGAGSLMCAFPHARLLVHPRGVRHMIDPSKLWEATCAVYGDDRAYVAVEETAATGADSDDAWTRAILKTATEREARTVGGRTWALYSDGGDPERRSLVGRIEGTLVVVTGLADLEVLEAAAGSLQSVEPTASSAPPSASATP